MFPALLPLDQFQGVRIWVSKGWHRIHTCLLLHRLLKIFAELPPVPVPTESKCDSSHLVISAGFLSLSGGFSYAVGCLA